MIVWLTIVIPSQDRGDIGWQRLMDADGLYGGIQRNLQVFRWPIFRVAYKCVNRLTKQWWMPIDSRGRKDMQGPKGTETLVRPSVSRVTKGHATLDVFWHILTFSNVSWWMKMGSGMRFRSMMMGETLGCSRVHWALLRIQRVPPLKFGARMLPLFFMFGKATFPKENSRGDSPSWKTQRPIICGWLQSVLTSKCCVPHGSTYFLGKVLNAPNQTPKTSWEDTWIILDP